MIGKAESFSKNNLQKIFIFTLLLLQRLHPYKVTRTQENRDPGSGVPFSHLSFSIGSLK